jgi:hypothetical protein
MDGEYPAAYLKRSAADAEVVVDFDGAAHEFQRRFPDGGLKRCDFHPYFEGFLVNAWSAMLPTVSQSATRERALALLAEIAAWLRAHANVFDAADELQLIVGFAASVKKDSRQIFKCWLPASGLNELRGVDFTAVGGGLRELESWPMGVEFPIAQTIEKETIEKKTGQSSMTPEQFDDAVQMLRSADPMTFEDGYHWLQGDNLIQYVPQIAGLLQSEVDSDMRSKFVELVGDADLPEHIPLLVQELSHETREVRFWAHNQLSLSKHESAKAHAEKYRETNPDEDFY